MEGLIYKDITQNKDGLYTLLLMTGYLTAVQNTTVPNGRLCQLKIPNEELTYVFQSEVLNLEPFSKSKAAVYRWIQAEADTLSPEIRYLILR